MKAAAAYVLAGGKSVRMGTDKAALPYGTGTLLDRVAAEARAAAGTVTIVGGVARPPYRMIPDAVENFGPVAGIAAALDDSAAEWTLILACDLPGVTQAWLRALIDSAEGDVTVACGADGRLHPLCSVWNRSALPAVQGALNAGVRRVHDLLARVDMRTLAADEQFTANINTPDEWCQFGAGA